MRKRAVVFGIFDGIHEGHRDLFRQARHYGHEFIVIVGRDSASLKWKGKKPFYSEQERLSLVLKEKLVNVALIGDEKQSTYCVLEDLNPDLICLGYDQKDLEEDLQKWMKRKRKEIPIFILKPYKQDVFHTSIFNGR